MFANKQSNNSCILQKIKTETNLNLVMTQNLFLLIFFVFKWIVEVGMHPIEADFHTAGPDDGLLQNKERVYQSDAGPEESLWCLS